MEKRRHPWIFTTADLLVLKSGVIEHRRMSNVAVQLM